MVKWKAVNTVTYPLQWHANDTVSLTIRIAIRNNKGNVSHQRKKLGIISAGRRKSRDLITWWAVNPVRLNLRQVARYGVSSFAGVNPAGCPCSGLYYATEAVFAGDILVRGANLSLPISVLHVACQGVTSKGRGSLYLTGGGWAFSRPG